AGLLEPVDVCDVRMIQRRECLGFTLEPGEAIGILRERRWQNLQSDRAAQRRVRRAIDDAHTAFADLRGQLIGADASTASDRHGFTCVDQFSTTVIGGAFVSSTMTFIRNRPSAATAYSGRPFSTLAPLASRVAKSGTGEPTSSV